MQDGEGDKYETGEEELRAFTAHNLITELAAARATVPRQVRQKPEDDTMIQISQVLRKTRNDSAPGPDDISWKLLKANKEYLPPPEPTHASRYRDIMILATPFEGMRGGI